MDKLVRKYRTLFRRESEREEGEGQKLSSSLPDQVLELIKTSEGAVSFAQLGSLQATNDNPQSDRLAPDMSPEESNICELTNDLDDATADMMAMFRNKREDSESSSSRSSIKSKYSILFETDNSEGEEEEADLEEGLEQERTYTGFLERESLSISIGHHDESR